jgi:hypothetical protein
MVISDEDFDAGLVRLREDAPVLTTDLTLWATVAQVPAEP